jgi:hypothetical protein
MSIAEHFQELPTIIDKALPTISHCRHMTANVNNPYMTYCRYITEIASNIEGVLGDIEFFNRVGYYLFSRNAFYMGGLQQWNWLEFTRCKEEVIRREVPSQFPHCSRRQF